MHRPLRFARRPHRPPPARSSPSDAPHRAVDALRRLSDAAHQPSTIPTASPTLPTASPTLPTGLPILSCAASAADAAYGNSRKKKGERTQGKSVKSLVGVPNYSSAEVDALLDIVERILPLGAHHWARVAEQYREWAAANDGTPRDQDSLESEFDKMNYTMKRTADPTCPANVRRAKRLGKAILKKCPAVVLGGESSDDGREGSDKENPRNTKTEVIGVRANKRKSGMAGLPGEKRYQVQVLEMFGAMTHSIGVMSKAVVAQDSHPAGLSREEVVQIVREQTMSREEVVKIVRDEVQIVRADIATDISSSSQNVISSVRDMFKSMATPTTTG